MPKLDEKIHVRTLGLMSEIDRVLSENAIDDNSIPARVERVLQSAAPNRKATWVSRAMGDEDFQVFLDNYTNERDHDPHMMGEDLNTAFIEAFPDFLELPDGHLGDVNNFIISDYCQQPCSACRHAWDERVSPFEYDVPPFSSEYETANESCGAEGCGCEVLFSISPTTEFDEHEFRDRVMFDGLSCYPVVGVWPKEDIMFIGEV